MNVSNVKPGKSWQRKAAAFTLVEIMVAMLVFSFLIAAMMMFQLFGMRIYTLSTTKMVADAGGLKTLNQIRDQIHSCQLAYVGIYSNASVGFNIIPSGLANIGNAVQIFTTNDSSSSQYTIFYQDPVHTNICSVSNNVVTVLAQSVTNFYCFQAEDCAGNLLMQDQDNKTIKITLQFVQWEYPIVTAGGGNAQDFYYLRTRVCPRVR